MSDPLTLTCPHCGSALTVDLAAGVVVECTPPAVHREKVDFDARLKEIEAEKRRASERMAEAMRKEQSKGRLLEDRFRKLVDDAKKTSDDGKPIRDIDLD
ncbi:MAG: hypothetical protein C3F15_12910 [Holophagae bacterium]|nr:MAG: hypothetical protein C3F15_12910 [Holophagae bacterium]